ncbi:ATP-binding protein [Azonexus sp.]|uniref:ATP-binding protein n=1 Tax=Azonexus sp. TaxID=1872668 RepID=UPI0039E661C8
MNDAPHTFDTLTLAAELVNLEPLQEHLAACARVYGLAERRIGLLTMAFEEIFVNICHYAYPAGSGPVTLICRVADGQFVVEVIDEGIAFDAASLAEPDLTAALEERKIGGLGWFLVRQIADRLECFRQEGRNVVRLSLRS